jgi:hypothetical protein
MPCVKGGAPAVALAFVCIWTGPASADQIVLKDGDRVTGKIVKKDGQILTVESKNFGPIAVKWDDIDTIQTDEPLNVVLPGDRTVKANLQSQDGRIQVAAPEAPQAVAAAEIVALRNEAEQRLYERLLDPGLLDLWTITGSLNIAGAAGNAKTSLITTPINFVRASRTSRTTAYFNSIRSKATVNGVSAETAQAVRGGWAFSRNLTNKIFFNAFNDYEYDKFQALDLRVVLGGGLGYQVWKGETGQFGFLGGFAWNREAFTPAPPALAFTRNSAEGYWGNDFNYKLNTRTSLVQAFRMFNNVSNGGEYRVNFDISASTALLRWLDWNVALSDRYLSNPAPGRKRNDFLYTTGFGFRFAR